MSPTLLLVLLAIIVLSSCYYIVLYTPFYYSLFQLFYFPLAPSSVKLCPHATTSTVYPTVSQVSFNYIIYPSPCTSHSLLLSFCYYFYSYFFTSIPQLISTSFLLIHWLYMQYTGTAVLVIFLCSFLQLILSPLFLICCFFPNAPISVVYLYRVIHRIESEKVVLETLTDI